MLDRYYPGPLREAKLSELLNLNPSEDDDVLSIVKKFHALLPFATSIVQTEVDKIKYFLQRLKPRTRMQLLNHHCTTLPEFIEKALEYELTAKEISKKQPKSNNKRFRNQNQTDGNRGMFKKPRSVQNPSEWVSMASKPAGSYSREANSSVVGGPGRAPTASHAPMQPAAQDRAPPFASYQTTGANRGLGRGNHAGVSGAGIAKPRVYEMKKVDDPEANMIAA
ncbi:hypothetical protein OROMI_026086 [Orobanche minor]